MNVKFILLPCFLLALFSSCRKARLSGEGGETATVALKECFQKTLGSDQLRLCLDGIVNDSRCPIDAVCVWQGAAIVRLNMTINNQPYNVLLATTTFNNIAPEATVQHYKIRLRNVLPYPGSTDLQKPSVEVQISPL